MRKEQKLNFYAPNYPAANVQRYCLNRGEPLDQEYLKLHLEDELGKSHIKFIPCSPAAIGHKIQELFNLYFEEHNRTLSEIELKKNAQIAISGIISPLSELDWTDLGNIVQNSIPKSIENSMLRFSVPRPLNRLSTLEFFNTYLGIPIFESWPFLPDYRHAVNLAGDFKPADFLPLVKSAYDIWINRNKETWREEIIYRNKNI